AQDSVCCASIRAVLCGHLDIVSSKRSPRKVHARCGRNPLNASRSPLRCEVDRRLQTTSHDAPSPHRYSLEDSMSSTRSSFPVHDVNAKTYGVTVPVLRSDDSERTAQLLGTVHTRRGRWNPFLPDNDMRPSEHGFSATVSLSGRGGRHGDGIYSLRFGVDHDLRKSWKFDLSTLDTAGKPTLVSGHDATRAHNLMFRVRESGEYRVDFDPVRRTYSIDPAPEYLTAIESVQLNGFVWDEESDFEKFDETRPGHRMRWDGTSWVTTVPLLRDGGISFRKDGVYQFLFSINQNEDWGFGADRKSVG